MLDLGTRIAAPFCAGLLGEHGRRGHQDRAARHRRLHARDRAVRPDDARRRRAGYSLFWAVEGRGRKSVTLDLRKPEGQDLFRRLAATADVVVENFRPGTLERWNIGPADLDPTPRRRAHQQRSARTARTRSGPASTASASATAACSTSPATPTGRRCASASRSPTTSPACSPRRPRSPRCTRATCTAPGKGAVIDAALYGAVAPHPRVDARRRTTGSASCASREGNRLANSAPLDNYPTADGKYVCIVAGSATPTSPASARRWTGPTCSTTPASPRSPTGPRTATRSTASSPSGRRRCTAAEIEERVRRPRRARRDRVHRGRHRSPTRTSPARGDLVTVDDPVAGPLRQQAPFPRFVGEPAAVPDRRARASASTPTRCSATCSASTPTSSTRSRPEGVI